MDQKMPPYPLQSIVEIKQRRVEEAEQVVKEKLKALDLEKEKLLKREEERNTVLKHKKEKLQQMRDELDSGTTSDKIQQMKTYLKIVQERLVTEEKKVKDQQDQVEIAGKNVELAKNHLKEKEREVDKLKMHRKEWERETRKELDILEVREMDEIGSTLFLTNMMKKRASKE